ncbi:MAG: tetratricopeptide repeat protein [Myxococcaceae bacterium]
MASPETPAVTGPEDEIRARLARLEREAKALGNDPASALLFHEIGLLHEELKNPRSAAVAYQNAYRIAPRFLPNLRAARRLFSEVGNWQMAVQLLDAEHQAVDDPRSRAALLFEKAQVLEDRLSKQDDATATYRKCLELKPQDAALLFQLESVFASRGDHTGLLDVYRQLAGITDEPAWQAHYLTASGVLLEDKLKQPEEAAKAFRAAFALERREPLLLASMRAAAERENRHEELLHVLTAEAELLGTQAAPAYLQLAKTYERLGRREDALSALLAARRVDPSEPLVLAALATTYEAEGRHDELADVLLAALTRITDEGEFVAVNLRLAALYEEVLKRDEGAIARYQAILDRVPGHFAALAGLGKLYFRTRNWEGLLGVYEAEISATTDPKQKAAKLYKAAEVLAERLGRSEDAISHLTDCLKHQPGYLPAQKALGRLYEQKGRFAELVAMHEQDLLQTRDRDQIIATLHLISGIYEERLSDLDRAIECMTRVLEAVSDHVPTIRNLARLYERAGRWREVIETHELEATLVGDIKQVLSLRHRSAEILDEHLKDRAGAIPAYERLLQLSPSYLPALQSLGRLYAQDGRWEDLTRMYRAEAEFAPNTDHAASLIAKIGELYEQKLGNENEAIAAYQEVLTLAPNYFPALRALARIYRAQGAHESLIEVLRSEAANRTDPAERANALFLAASIWEEPLRRTDLATEGYQEVLKLVPGHPTALRALERVYTLSGSLKELMAILDRETQTGQTPAAKISAFVKLGRLYLERFEETGRAAQCYEAVLGLDPNNLTALKGLERIRASDRSRRGELKVRLAERLPDGKLRRALTTAAVFERESPSAIERLDALRTAFAQDPTDARLAYALERGLRKSGDFVALLALEEQRLAKASSSEERAEAAVRAGEAAERLNDHRKAAALFTAALDHKPGFLAALDGSVRAALAIGDFGAARGALEAKAKVSKDTRTSVESSVSAARLSAERLDDLDGAAAHYRKALERDPLDPEASHGLEELLARRGGVSDLAMLHERRGEAKLAQRDNTAAAVELYRAARVWLDQLQDKERSQSAVERALVAQPNHVDALELKAELALSEHRYAEAAAALSGRLQQGGDARALSAIHLKVGALFQDHLGDMSRAAAHLQSALTGEPRNIEALERLSSLHGTSRNWTGAADALRRLLDIDTETSAKGRHTLALANIMDEGFGDMEQATQLYRQAQELLPHDGQVLDRLVALYERSGQLPALAQTLEAQVATADPERQQLIRLRVASIYGRSLEEASKAIDTYRRVVERDPNQSDAWAALADLYSRDAALASQAIEAHRQLLRIDATRVDSIRALFRLWESLKHRDRAFCAAGILVFLRAANDAELSAYADGRSALPADSRDVLGIAELEQLMHKDARGPVTAILRGIGDQLSKLYPPQLEALGIDKRADKLRPDHAIHKAVRAVAHTMGVTEFDVYQSRRGNVALETTEPLSVCVGQDVVRKFNAREQRFLIARAVLGLVHRTAVLAKLSQGETADLIGHAVRIHHPEFALVGKRNDDAVKALRKALSRKAIKTLEAPAKELTEQSRLDLPPLLQALTHSADRAGLLLCGDVAVALNVVFREDPSVGSKAEHEPTLGALKHRADLRSLIQFALSEDFFRLRQRVGPSL